MHVMVLHVTCWNHEAHAPRWIKCWSRFSQTIKAADLPQRRDLLTDTSIPRPRCRRRQSREPEDRPHEYRAQCWPENLPLSRIETDSKCEEYQAQSKHVFHREQLSRRDLICIDCAAWYRALLDIQHSVTVSPQQKDLTTGKYCSPRPNLSQYPPTIAPTVCATM